MYTYIQVTDKSQWVVFLFTSFDHDTSIKVGCFMNSFTFCILGAFLQLPLLYGLRLSIEGSNETCRSLN